MNRQHVKYWCYKENNAAAQLYKLEQMWFQSIRCQRNNVQNIEGDEWENENSKLFVDRLNRFWKFWDHDKFLHFARGKKENSQTNEEEW